MSNSSEKVLEIADKLGASGVDFSQETASIETLIALAKSGDIKTKILVAGLIPQHISNFGSLISAAVDAQLDICEDSIVEVRVAGIRGISRIVSVLQDNSVIERCIDAVLQLYVSAEDESELHALNHVIKLTSKSKPVQFGVVGLQLLPNQTGEARTKLMELLKKVFHNRELIQMRAQISELANALASTLSGVHASLTHDEYTFFMGILGRNGKTHDALRKTLTIARSRINEPLTAESLSSIASNVSALGKLAEDSDLLVQIYNTAFASLAFANDESKMLDVRNVLNLAVNVSKYLTPRQCNAVFGPFYEAFLSILSEKQAVYPYQIIARLLTLFHVLAAPLKDTLRDTTGLTVVSIQPSTVSNEVRDQRRAVLQASVQNVVDSITGQIDAVNALIPKDGFSRNNKYKKALRLAAKAEAKQAKLGGAEETPAAVDEITTAAEAEKTEIAEAVAADEAAAEAKEETEGSTGKVDVIPFTEAESHEFIKNTQKRATLTVTLKSITGLAEPILTDMPIFLTLSQINEQNENITARNDKKKQAEDSKKSKKANYKPTKEEKEAKLQKRADFKKERAARNVVKQQEKQQEKKIRENEKKLAKQGRERKPRDGGRRPPRDGKREDRGERDYRPRNGGGDKKFNEQRGRTNKPRGDKW